MSKGIFSEAFTPVFDDTLGDVFDFDFPSKNGAGPDPASHLPSAAVPGAGAPLEVALPELDALPVEAMEGAGAVSPVIASVAPATLSAVAFDIPGMANKPGGTPGGGPGNGGGGGGGGGSDPVLAATYTSGDSAVADSMEYNVVVEFYGDWPRHLMDAFGAAADFLSSIITADLADDPLSQNTFSNEVFTVDDLLIEAYLPTIDGTGGILGSAGPYSVRNLTTDITTVVGSMEFDVADAENLYTDGNWDAVILHEMLHVLGIGTLWDFWGVSETNDMGTRRPNDDVLSYTGATGLSQYQTETGDSILLIETDGGSGTAGGHWDELAYGNELMTGYVNGVDPYLADWTIASLNDIGYTTTTAYFGGGATDNPLGSGINLDSFVIADADLIVADATLIV